MAEDPYLRDVYQAILELFEKGRDETAYKIYFLIQ
ncbi:hypothetical protein J5U23_02136 [Saccharolobus shibatae B12]|uniref:Uncharacterized protein n=2 Tax=Saccharolobus shibatae TaxID=2286 RepID=A0A8F5GUD4_SACSH|nr:hypothetical protein J5U23_02136 [Saccharolobus shibatae B12]QXJ35649.1 hypothetical protein J5U22_02196 [Saccharolobus shibatae]